MPSRKLSALHTGLIRRYLTWAYKSTKESFDRLERKTTQLMVDDRIWAEIQKNKIPAAGAEEYAEELEAFKAYVDNKRSQSVAEGKHAYLRHRLAAIEKTIVYFLGAKELGQMKNAYEAEFTRRIWESKDH